MSVLDRLLALLRLRRRRAVPALAPPDFVSPPTLTPEAFVLTHTAPPESVILPRPDAETQEALGMPLAPGTSLAPAAPHRRRVPADPAQRARYFGAAYIPLLTTARLTAATPQPTADESLPLRSLATGMAMPRQAGRVAQIEPIRFSAFAVWPEAAPEVPQDAVQLWRKEPELLAQAFALRDAVLGNAAFGGMPLRPLTLFDLAMRETGHAGTALLLCHLVARAFARGGTAVTWRAVDRRRGTFSDGIRLHRLVPRAREETMEPSAAPVFYALFAASALGVADTGDWYRFFALSALALLAASGGCLPPQPVADGPALNFARSIDRVATEMRNEVPTDSAACRAWRWANALCFTEFALWGRSDPRALEASRIGLTAAVFGLRMAGAKPDSEWRWVVPRAGGWRGADMAGPIPVAGLLRPGNGLEA